MPPALRIFNVSRGFYLKRTQALRGIEACALAWVDHGRSVRSLTLAESIAARNAQAQAREPLPLAELHGITFDRAGNEMRIAYQANQFAEAAGD